MIVNYLDTNLHWILKKLTDLYVESNRVIDFTVAGFRNPVQLDHFPFDVESLHKKLLSI